MTLEHRLWSFVSRWVRSSTQRRNNGDNVRRVQATVEPELLSFEGLEDGASIKEPESNAGSNDDCNDHRCAR